jgi:hypothetical protein
MKMSGNRRHLGRRDPFVADLGAHSFLMWIFLFKGAKNEKSGAFHQNIKALLGGSGIFACGVFVFNGAHLFDSVL